MSIKQIKILACQSHVMASAWILIGILSAVFKINKHNNFDIFRYVFFNTIEHRNLYAPSFYREWYVNLTEKNHGNEMSIGTNISLLGLLRKIGYTCAVGFSAGIAAIRDNSLIDKSNWWIASFSDAWVIITGLLVTATGYFRIRQWKNEFFRMTILADVLMFVCFFYTGTESSGYITALIGCVIWYVSVPWERSFTDKVLMVIAFILTSLSPSDSFPSFLRQELVQPLALKSLPVVLVWLKLTYELLTKDYVVKE